MRKTVWRIIAGFDQAGLSCTILGLTPKAFNQSAHTSELFERLTKVLMDVDNEVLTQGSD